MLIQINLHKYIARFLTCHKNSCPGVKDNHSLDSVLHSWMGWDILMEMQWLYSQPLHKWLYKKLFLWKSWLLWQQLKELCINNTKKNIYMNKNLCKIITIILTSFTGKGKMTESSKAKPKCYYYFLNICCILSCSIKYSIQCEESNFTAVQLKAQRVFILYIVMSNTNFLKIVKAFILCI